jgi:hypothetical protein
MIPSNVASSGFAAKAGMMVDRGMTNEDPAVDGDQYGPEEIARRMERGLRRALSTPAKPHGKNPSSPPESKPEKKKRGGAAKLRP